MSFKIFLETTGKKLIVVDIQPAYSNHIFFMDEFAKFLSQYNEVLILYVGELTGDTKSTIAKYYFQHGVPKSNLYSFKWFDKGYAYFRDMMDSKICFAREDIVKLVRYMIRNKVNDTRDLSRQQIKGLKISNFTYKQINDYFVGIPDIRWLLRKWNGADICGGGLNECLEEVLILCDAMNVQYNIVQQFTY